jgi:hypothetical protein
MLKNSFKIGPISLSHGLQCHYVNVGQEFGDFLDLQEKIFSTNKIIGSVIPTWVYFVLMFQKQTHA